MIKIKISDNIIFLFFLLAFVIALLNPFMEPANFIGIFDLIPNGNLILIIITFIGMIISYFYPYMLKSKSFNKDDFNKNIDYYKDILHEYTPGIISYIDDFKVDKKTLIATLMSLEKKQKINFKDNIEIINTDSSDLTLHEKYIYEIIEKENFELLSYETLKNEIIKDCDILNLVQPNKKNSIFHSKLFRLAILIEVIGVPLSTLQFLKFENEILKLLSKLAPGIPLIGVFLFFISITTSLFSTIAADIEKDMIPYLRTKKGENLNKKIEGLKRYLKEFSTLKDESKDAMTIWDDYLIYSVLFGQNTQIIDEYVKNYNIK